VVWGSQFQISNTGEFDRRFRSSRQSCWPAGKTTAPVTATRPVLGNCARTRRRSTRPGRRRTRCSSSPWSALRPCMQNGLLADTGRRARHPVLCLPHPRQRLLFKTTHCSVDPAHFDRTATAPSKPCRPDGPGQGIPCVLPQTTRSRSRSDTACGLARSANCNGVELQAGGLSAAPATAVATHSGIRVESLPRLLGHFEANRDRSSGDPRRTPRDRGIMTHIISADPPCISGLA
jgi:hypothetical protein